MIRTVIFDVDDTLYSFHRANEAAVNALVIYTKEHFGWDKDEFLDRQKLAMADIRRYAGTSGGYRSRILRYQNMLEAAGQRIYPHAQTMSSIYQHTLLENMIPEPGAEKWMRSLKDNGIRVGIGSDATAQQQFLKLEKLGFLPLIDFMVTSEEAGAEKPDPRFFARCHEKCVCQKKEVMFIGDNFDKDYAGAKEFGYNAVWYDPQGKKGHKPDFELHHFDDAPVLLNILNREEYEE